MRSNKTRKSGILCKLQRLTTIKNEMRVKPLGQESVSGFSEMTWNKNKNAKCRPYYHLAEPSNRKLYWEVEDKTKEVVFLKRFIAKHQNVKLCKYCKIQWLKSSTIKKRSSKKSKQKLKRSKYYTLIWSSLLFVLFTLIVLHSFFGPMLARVRLLGHCILHYFCVCSLRV